MQWQWSEVSWARRALAPGFSQAAPVFSGQFCCAFMPSRSTQPDQACEIAGVPPQYEEIEFADEDELRAFVADRNERRDITSGGGGPRQAVPRSQEDRAGK